MDFNVNVKLDATPALVGVVATLATALSGCAIPQVSKTILPSNPTAFSPLPEQPEAGVHTSSSPEVQSPTATSEQTSTDISDTMVREAVAVQAKAGKKTEIKALLTEFGVKSSPELPKERRAEFVQKLKAL